MGTKSKQGPNPKRYPSPRFLTRSIRAANGLPRRLPMTRPLTTSPAFEKVEVVHKPEPIRVRVKQAFQGFKAKLARAFRATRGH